MSQAVDGVSQPASSTCGEPRLGSGTAWAHELVARQAVLRPAALAVRHEKHELTFLELDQRANRMARHLQTLGVGAETPVGLYFERSADFVVAALAVLKAGGGYLPLDITHPAGRIDAILQDAGVKVLLSHRALARVLEDGLRNTVDLDADAARIANHSAVPLATQIAGHDLAYIIYTSGSTGRPKGVEVTHANLSHLIRWHTSAHAVNPQDRASQTVAFAFDSAVLEIWGHLAAGASLHLTDELSRRSPEALRDWLLEQRITTAFVPTIIAEHLIMFDWPAHTALHTLATGGDTLHRHPKAGLPFTVENQYGPTECTVLVTAGLVSSEGVHGRLPSIGRPIDDTEIVFVDENLRPVAPGEEGEICVSGPQVARGYRNLPDLTAEKFVVKADTSRRLYRTGDRGRLLANGEIAFLGRIDDLIKIRGYRIEPAEIVAHLIAYPGVRDSAVVAFGDNHLDKTLVGYVVPESNSELTATMLKEYLRALVPEYMIPTSFVGLPSLPLTAAGKFAKSVLPAPSAANLLPESFPASSGKQVSRSVTEERIAQLVKGLMGGRTISHDDDFFLAGGNSMLASQLLASVHEHLGVRLSLRQLFGAPTIASLADAVDQKLATR